MNALLVMLLVSAPGPPAVAADANAPWFPTLLNVGVALRGTVLDNVPRTTLDVDPSSGRWLVGDLYRPQAALVYPSGFVIVDAEVEFLSWLSAHALLSTNEVRPGSSLDPNLSDPVTANGQSFVDALTNTSMIKELEVVFQTRHFTAALGKRRITVGQGLLYDDFAVGVDLHAHLGEADKALPWHLQLTGMLLARDPQDPLPQSPFVVLSGEYQPSMFESVGVFGAYYYDAAGGLDDVITSALAEGIISQSTPARAQVLLSRLFLRPRTGLGTMGYAGATANLTPVRGLRLKGAAMLGAGTLNVAQTAGPTLAMQLSGWAAHARATWEVVPSITVSALAFGISGDQPPPVTATQASYRAFIGVAPFLTWTGLFFTGGLNQGIFSGRASAAGINGHGVAGGGLTGEWGTLDGRVELRTMLLSALSPAPAQPLGGGGSWYGVEIDLIGEWPLLNWLKLSAEGDMLVPGSFFPQANVAWRALVQAYVSWSN